MIISTGSFSMRIIGAFILRELLCGSAYNLPTLEEVWPRDAFRRFIAPELQTLFLNRDRPEFEWMPDLLRYLNDPMSPEGVNLVFGPRAFFGGALWLQNDEPQRCHKVADKAPVVVTVESTLSAMIINRDAHDIRVLDVVPSAIDRVEILAEVARGAPRNVAVHLKRGAQPNVFVNAVGTSCDRVLFIAADSETAADLEAAIAELKAQTLERAAALRRSNPVLGPCELVEVSEGRILPLAGTVAGQVALGSDAGVLEREADKAALIRWTYGVRLGDATVGTLSPPIRRPARPDGAVIWGVGDGRDLLAARHEREAERQGAAARLGEAGAEADAFLDALAGGLEDRPAPTEPPAEASAAPSPLLCASPDEMTPMPTPPQPASDSDARARPRVVRAQMHDILTGLDTAVLREVARIAAADAPADVPRSVLHDLVGAAVDESVLRDTVRLTAEELRRRAEAEELLQSNAGAGPARGAKRKRPADAVEPPAKRPTRRGPTAPRREQGAPAAPQQKRKRALADDGPAANRGKRAKSAQPPPHPATPPRPAWSPATPLQQPPPPPHPATPPRPAWSPATPLQPPPPPPQPATPPSPLWSPAISMQQSVLSCGSLSPADSYFREKMESQLAPDLFAAKLCARLVPLVSRYDLRPRERKRRWVDDDEEATPDGKPAAKKRKPEEKPAARKRKLAVKKRKPAA